MWLLQSVIDGRIVIDPPASADSNLFEHLSSEATELQTATNDVPKHSGISGGLLIACMPSIGQVVHLTQLGSLSKQTASEVCAFVSILLCPMLI
jgi:hypothetical protein